MFFRLGCVECRVVKEETSVLWMPTLLQLWSSGQTPRHSVSVVLCSGAAELEPSLWLGGSCSAPRSASRPQAASPEGDTWAISLAFDRVVGGCPPIFPVPQEEPHKIEMQEPRFIYEVATVHSSGSHGAGIVTLAGV